MSLDFVLSTNSSLVLVQFQNIDQGKSTGFDVGPTTMQWKNPDLALVIIAWGSSPYPLCGYLFKDVETFYKLESELHRKAGIYVCTSSGAQRDKASLTEQKTVFPNVSHSPDQVFRLY